MMRNVIAGGAFVAVLILIAIFGGLWRVEQASQPVALGATETHPEPESHEGFIYGRVTTVDRDTVEGRLRWGRGEEAFWGDYFNGFKDQNPWLEEVPEERRPRERRPIEVLGFQIVDVERQMEPGRPFMARYGDIARIEASGSDVRVTLKSGTAFDLDRFEAGDFDDGLRVWDGTRGAVDLDSLQIRMIEFLPTPPLGEAPYRLYGTVRTRQGVFTGFIQWDRQECTGTDRLVGSTSEGAVTLRFGSIRSIARQSDEGALVTLLDDREIVLSDGRANRGIYVDDKRYGRVLVSWEAFERVEFSDGGSGPAYREFPAGAPLNGSVTTRGGERFAGRLVYDLDESETTETLDAPSGGVDYTIPFRLIASVAPGDGRVMVKLRDGEELRLDRSGDFGEENAGVLVFGKRGGGPEYVPWAEVERIELN